jgi:hypothetical protein
MKQLIVMDQLWHLVRIDIDPNDKPVHSMPHPVPQIHLKTFKKIKEQQSMLDTHVN